MLHLLLANKVRPDGSALFYLGNIAPDAVNDRHVKDITHFRNLKNRQDALIKLAQETADDFAEGVLLHLYYDWKWDSVILRKFVEATGDDWFSLYRSELSYAGNHAFHNTTWAKRIWNDMDALEVSRYGATPCAAAIDVKGFLLKSIKWLNDNMTMPSQAFPPQMVEEFTSETACAYIEWRNGPSASAGYGTL
jgi:hypothetical protein